MNLVKSTENELSKALHESISLTNLEEIGIDIAEATIDSVLKEGFFKDIPIIGTLVGLWKTGVNVRDYLFLNKLLAFLKEASGLSLEKRRIIVEKLEDEPFQMEAGEKLLAIIDKIDTIAKAKILGKAISLAGNEKISKDEFWRIAYIIERLPMTDIRAIKNWMDTDLNKVESVRRHLYLSVGLGWFVLNVSSTGFVWQRRLCEIFANELL